MHAKIIAGRLRSTHVMESIAPIVLVSLSVAQQSCALPVATIRDVLGQQTITPVPLAPREIAGNLNLRGRIVTAICLRRRLGMMDPLPGQERMAAVAEHGGNLYAFLVDEIGDVMTFDATSCEQTPPNLSKTLTFFSEGVFRLPSRLMLLLSVSRLIDMRLQTFQS